MDELAIKLLELTIEIQNLGIKYNLLRRKEVEYKQEIKELQHELANAHRRNEYMRQFLCKADECKKRKRMNKQRQTKEL